MDTTLAAAAIVAMLVAMWVWWQRQGGAGELAELRRICFGDAQMAERLIEGELRRASGTISRAEAARRAIERYRRDNR